MAQVLPQRGRKLGFLVNRHVHVRLIVIYNYIYLYNSGIERRGRATIGDEARLLEEGALTHFGLISMLFLKVVIADLIDLRCSSV